VKFGSILNQRPDADMFRFNFRILGGELSREGESSRSQFSEDAFFVSLSAYFPIIDRIPIFFAAKVMRRACWITMPYSFASFFRVIGRYKVTVSDIDVGHAGRGAC